MRTTYFLIATFSLLLGCSEGVSTADADPDTRNADSPDAQQSSVSPSPSRLAANPTSQLINYYLHYYDQNEDDQDYELHDEVQQELISRGADSVSELLKISHSLNKYPYSYQSSELIKAIGPDARQAIPALVDFVVRGTRQETGSCDAKECLVAIGPESIPELIKHFNGEDLYVARAVSYPLRQLGAEVVPHLKPSLKSEIPERRRLALDTLAEIGHDAAELIPQVRHLMENDTEYGNRVFAARTLADIGDEQAGLSFLIAEVKHWNERLLAQNDQTYESNWAIAAIDRSHVRDNPAVIDVLLETLEHPIAQRRSSAIGALATHSHAPRVQAAFQRMLENKAYKENYFKIADELGRWGSQFTLDHEDAVMALLEKRLAETDEKFKLGISNGLGRIIDRRMMDAIRGQWVEKPQTPGLR